jgi:hypothetical protein
MNDDPRHVIGFRSHILASRRVTWGGKRLSVVADWGLSALNKDGGGRRWGAEEGAEAERAMGLEGAGIEAEKERWTQEKRADRAHRADMRIYRCSGRAWRLGFLDSAHPFRHPAVDSWSWSWSWCSCLSEMGTESIRRPPSTDANRGVRPKISQG